MPDDNLCKSIGTDRQLFVDAYWIDEASGVERRLHEPERREIAIESNETWDLNPCAAKFM